MGSIISLPFAESRPATDARRERLCEGVLRRGPGDAGRFFLQVHYGRRDLAQRLRPTSVANQLSDEAMARAATPRERTLIGLHEPRFYDG